MMNLRDIALISTATVFGGVAYAMAIHFFFNPTRRKRFSPADSTISKKIGSRCPFDQSKRQGYLSWDDYFMAIAFLSAERSKDPSRQVGACLVSEHGVILGFSKTINSGYRRAFTSWDKRGALCIGYNGFPRGCSDDKLPWSKKSRTGNPLDTKYPYVCHAEVNAILNTNHASAAGQRLYVTMFPCNECAKIIIQSGVSEVIYFVEKRLNNSDTAYVASHNLLSMAGVKVRKHQPQMDRILIKFEEH